MSFNDKQIQAPHPPFPVDHIHPWHKGSKVGSKEMDIAVLSPSIGRGPTGAKGDKGDAFTFDDFTEAQLATIRANIIGFTVTRYKITYSDFTYVDELAAVKSFGTAFDTTGNHDRFIELVYKNGLLIRPNEEYGFGPTSDLLGTFEGWELYFQDDMPIPISTDVYDVIIISLKTSS